MRPTRAFSLIELLVVISIVTVLIAVLLPTLSLSRDVAASSVCLSNQRQIGIASAAYQGQFRGVNAPTWKLHNTAIPAGTLNYRRRVDPNLSATDKLFGIPALYPGTSSSGWIWSNYLLGQLGTVNALICPSRQTAWIKPSMNAIREADPNDGQGYIPLNGSYGVNVYIYEGLTSGMWVRPEKLRFPSQTV
jgi:prepilin-type N-terminal cleavage/methylation domain-containing protein